MAIVGVGVTNSPAAFPLVQFQQTERLVDPNVPGALGVPGETKEQLMTDLDANGSQTFRLAPAQISFEYDGQLLGWGSHLQNGAFVLQQVDFQA